MSPEKVEWGKGYGPSWAEWRTAAPVMWGAPLERLKERVLEADSLEARLKALEERMDAFEASLKPTEAQRQRARDYVRKFRKKKGHAHGADES